MAHLNLRLPTDVEAGAVGGFEFMTNVHTADSGHEGRVARWDECRGKWDVRYGIRTLESLRAVVSLHRVCRGRAHSFLFKHHLEFEAEDEVIGEGDNLTSVFDLVKTDRFLDDLGDPIASYSRFIRFPVEDTVVIKHDSVVVDPVDYTILNGQVLFLSPPVYGTLTWSGQFDVPVRFDVDHLRVRQDVFHAGTVPEIRIIEVLPIS